MQAIDILRAAIHKGASDIHILSGWAPMFRINGYLTSLEGFPPLSPDQAGAFISHFMTDEHRLRFQKDLVIDFSMAFENVRFRVNVFYQQNGLEAVLRLIPSRIPTPEELALPPAILQLADLSRGLVLLTGTTGSGKSTTLACLIDQINRKRHANIITIEDPIEFLHHNQLSVVSQREVGLHTPDFNHALKYVLRQDPDVVLVGEMRDYETIATTISIAETGHLVFATLHTIDAAQAVDRMIDAFPGNQQTQARTQLSNVLRAVVSQVLVPRADGKGRAAAREIMVVTPAIGNLIRLGRTHEIYTAIDTGAMHGMMGMDRCLSDLVKQGVITSEEAATRYSRPDTSQPKFPNHSMRIAE